LTRVKYSCFDRVVLRGYIRWLFFPGGVVKFLRLMGFRKLSNGVMRILTDQLNAHILKVAQAKEIHIHWRPSVDGGKDGAKQKFVQEKYARNDAGRGDRLYCILTDKEPVRTFACRELTGPIAAPNPRPSGDYDNNACIKHDDFPPSPATGERREDHSLFTAAGRPDTEGYRATRPGRPSRRC